MILEHLLSVYTLRKIGNERDKWLIWLIIWYDRKKKIIVIDGVFQICGGSNIHHHNIQR